MLKNLTNLLLIPLALFIFISHSAFSKPIGFEEAKEIAIQHNLHLNKYSIELQDPSAYKLIASSNDIFSRATKILLFIFIISHKKVIIAGDDI